MLCLSDHLNDTWRFLLRFSCLAQDKAEHASLSNAPRTVWMKKVDPYQLASSLHQKPVALDIHCYQQVYSILKTLFETVHILQVNLVISKSKGMAKYFELSKVRHNRNVTSPIQ